MIFGLILLDVLINNYTKYTSYFFIIYLYNKSYKYYLITGLILDFIIFDKLLMNTLVLTIMFFINKLFKDLNKNNIYYYIFVNFFNYLLFIIISNLLSINSIYNILIIIGKNLVINVLFYILSHRIQKKIVF